MMDVVSYRNRFRGDPGQGRWHNLARHRGAQGRVWGPHRHAYHELFWVESGNIQHDCDGASEVLPPGSLAFVRPEHAHSGHALDPGGATWVNVELPSEMVDDYALRFHDLWPWRPGPALHRRLDGAGLARLEAWTALLALPGASRLDTETFLLDVARLAAAPSAPAATRGLPAWLAQAAEELQRGRRFAGGVPLLAHLAGRSPAHVARTVRACQGRRATDLVNELRLTWVAVELRLSDRPIAELAEGCGLPNLGHFYRLFRRAYGCTPLAFRTAARGGVPEGPGR